MRIHNYNTRDCALQCALDVCNMLKHNALSVPFLVPFVCPKSMQYTENQHVCCALHVMQKRRLFIFYYKVIVNVKLVHIR